MTSKFFSFLCVVSTLLFVVNAVLWVRSYWRLDIVKVFRVNERTYNKTPHSFPDEWQRARVYYVRMGYGLLDFGCNDISGSGIWNRYEHRVWLLSAILKKNQLGMFHNCLISEATPDGRRRVRIAVPFWTLAGVTAFLPVFWIIRQRPRSAPPLAHVPGGASAK